MIHRADAVLSATLAASAASGLGGVAMSAAQTVIGPSESTWVNMGLLGLAILGGIGLHRLLMVAQEQRYTSLQKSAERELQTLADAHAEVLAAKEEAATYLRHRIDAEERTAAELAKRNDTLMEALATEKRAMVELATDLIGANKDAIAAFGQELTLTRGSVHELGNRSVKIFGQVQLALRRIETALGSGAVPAQGHAVAGETVKEEEA